MKGGKIAAVVVSLAAAAIAAALLRGIGRDPPPMAGPVGPPVPAAGIHREAAVPPPDRPGEAPPAVPTLPLVGLVLREERPAAAEVTVRRLADLPRDEDADEEGSRFRSWGSLYDGLEPDVRELVRTAGDGRFSVRNPGAGAFLLEARAGLDQAGAVAILLDADGRPLAGAEGRRAGIEIHLLDAPCALRGRAALPDGTPWTGRVGVCLENQERADPAPVATAADGTFRIEGLPSTLVQLFALEPGRRREAGPRVMLPCAEEVLLIVGGPGEVVSGRVVEEPGGAPVPGARVTLKSRGGGWISVGYSSWAGLLTAISVPVDSQGRFRAALRTEPEKGLYLHAEAPGYSSREDGLSLPDIRDPAGIEIRLSRPGAVSGRVLVEGTEAPVPGAEVRIPPEDFRGIPGVGTGPRATTDAEGRFRFEGLPAGRHPVEVLAEGWISPHLATEAGSDATLDVLPVGATVRDLHVVPAPWIHGSVLGADGHGVGGVTVKPERTVVEGGFRSRYVWVPEAACLPPEVVTAPDGTFRFGAIQGIERVRFVAWRDGRVIGAAGPYMAEAGDGTGVDILLRSGRRLEVAVRTADGAPAAGALVRLKGGLLPDEELDLGGSVPADGSGIAVFEGVPDTSLRVWAVHPRDSLAEAERWFEGVPESGRIVIRLPPGAGGAIHSVAGVAVMEDGTPAVDAWAEAKQEDPFGEEDFDRPEPAGMRTDGLGRFRITGLRPGPCGISLTLPGEGGEHRGEATAVAGQEDVRVVLRFEPAEEEAPEIRRTLTIRVLDPEGNPVPAGELQVKVTVEGRRGYSSFGDSFKEGVGTSEVVEHWFPGTIRICAFHAADAEGRPLPYGSASIGPVPLGDGPFEIRLPPEEILHGRVLGPDGSPFAGAHVLIEFLTDPDGGAEDWKRAETAVTDSEGRFRFGRLGSGGHRVSCGESGFVPVEVSARPGPEEVVLRLRRSVDARVMVLDPEGRPVGSARVRVYAPERDLKAESLRSGGTLATGVATLRDLDPEQRLELEVDPPGSVDDLHPHMIMGWKAADTEVRLLRAYILEVAVEDPAGRPVPNALVRCTGAGSDETLQDGTTDPDGRYVLRRLPSGTVTVSATLPEAPEETGTVEVSTSADAGRVRLVLDPGPEIRIRLDPAAAGLEWNVALAVQGEPEARLHDSGDEGEIRLRCLEEGVLYDAVVSVHGRGAAVLRGLKAGGPAVEVVVGQGRSIDCRVLLAEGAYVQEAVVLVGEAPLVVPASLNAMENGRIRFRGLPEGTWRVRIQVKDQDGTLRTFLREVDAGGSVEVDAR